jgi:hypothetical protein
MTYYRNAGSANPVLPATPSDVCGLGGELKTTGHTEWTDGKVHQTGFTAVFTPNTKVECPAGSGIDVDWTNWQETKEPNPKTTWAAVTSRSHHPTLVNVALVDGSCRPVADTIDLAVWRALSTRNGGESLTGEF